MTLTSYDFYMTQCGSTDSYFYHFSSGFSILCCICATKFWRFVRFYATGAVLPPCLMLLVFFHWWLVHIFSLCLKMFTVYMISKQGKINISIRILFFFLNSAHVEYALAGLTPADLKETLIMFNAVLLISIFNFMLFPYHYRLATFGLF